MLTLSQLLQKNNSSLKNADLILLLAGALKKNKEFIFTHPEYQPNLIERSRWFYYLQKLKHGYPVAYILKTKEFFGLDFFVNKHTLIPRPDTEILVEEVIKIINEPAITKAVAGKKNVLLIDVGTGSGCIPIAILKNIKTSGDAGSPLPLSKGEVGRGLETIAIDISRQALKVAQKNAKTHNVKINFLRGNLLKPILKKSSLFFTSYSSIIITANLPYLTSNQMNEPSIKREPKTALYGGADGLIFYEKLLEQIKDLSSDFVAFLEIDPDQTEEIKSRIKKYLPQANIEIIPDLSQLNRVVKIN